MSTLDSNPANPATVSLRPVALRWGLILAGISALLTLIGFLTDTDPSMPDTGTAVKLLYGLLGFGIMIACIVAAIRQHRDKDLGGYITLGRALMVGLVTGLVAGVLGAVFFMLYATIINPDFTENMKDGMAAPQTTPNARTCGHWSSRFCGMHSVASRSNQPAALVK